MAVNYRGILTLEKYLKLPWYVNPRKQFKITVVFFITLAPKLVTETGSRFNVLPEFTSINNFNILGLGCFPRRKI
jgi:hypothetical protein